MNQNLDSSVSGANFGFPQVRSVSDERCLVVDIFFCTPAMLRCTPFQNKNPPGTCKISASHLQDQLSDFVNEGNGSEGGGWGCARYWPRSGVHRFS